MRPIRCRDVIAYVRTTNRRDVIAYVRRPQGVTSPASLSYDCQIILDGTGYCIAPAEIELKL